MCAGDKENTKIHSGIDISVKDIYRYAINACCLGVQFQAYYSCASREFEPQLGDPSRDYPPNFQTRGLIIQTVAQRAALFRTIRYNSWQSADILAGYSNSFYRHSFLPKKRRSQLIR